MSAMKNLTILFLLINAFVIESNAELNWTEVQIPMSDGQTLAGDVYLPDNWTSGPTILIQTPYWKDLYHLFGLPMGIFYNQEEMDYAMVIVDWRGFFGSTDAAYAGSPTRGEDGYQVVEWIAAQEWSDGKVGTWGPSALGKVQFLTAREHPPHLVCIAPQVASPLYEYQEYFYNGAAKTEFIEQLDVLGFGMSPVLYANPYYSFAWTFSETSSQYMDEIDLPVFMLGGWYDHNIETMLQTFQELQNTSAPNVQDQHRLVMGPWVHGGSGTALVGSNLQGQLEYPGAEAWSDSLSFVFFDYYLKEIDNGWDQTPPVQYFQMGDDEWLSSNEWPVSTTNTRLYMHFDQSLSVSTPPLAAAIEFNYNPEDPSPTIGGPTLRTDLDQGPFDQSEEVESRDDILIFNTDVLPADVVVKGAIKVGVAITTDVPDTDVAVRVCDVYPDGRSMLVNCGIYRLRFLNGFELADEAFLQEGEVYQAIVDMPNTAITFKEGHRIRIDVTGSNYPMYNRNMNTGGEMYPNGNGDTLVDPVVAHNALIIDLGTVSGSYVDLPMVGSYPTAMEEIVASSRFSIFPNPTADEITITRNASLAGKTSVSLLDEQGRTVKTWTIFGEKENLDLRTIASGQYNLVIKSGERHETTRLVIVH